MNPKVLIIGLDAATMDLIEPWARSGDLPTLAKLMRDGAHGRLLSTPNMHSASAWTSILTGLDPGNHGMFVFSDRDYATNKQLFFKGGDRDGSIASAHLAQYGMTSGFLNVPMTYPAESCGAGFMISGLDGPALDAEAFQPPELRDEILSKFPDYHFSPPGLGDLMRAGRIDEAAGLWKKLTETQTVVADYLMTTRPVDLFMTVYTASDWGGHNLWRYLDDQDGGDHDGKSATTANPLLSLYRALDDAIATLLSHADEHTQIYIISDHGMGRHTGASFHLAGWLEDRGYMVRGGGSQTRTSLVRAGRRAARALLPLGMREKLKSGLGSERMTRLQTVEKDSFYDSIDWPRTRAYTEPGRHVININLAGRNLHGVVPESEYDATCAKIIDDLGGWTDAAGRQVVARVTRRNQSYFGPYRDRASDLYVHWNPDAKVDGVPEEMRARGFWWSGDHRPEGILICRGPGIRAGRNSLKNGLPRVSDLLPTVMYLAGLPVPNGLDGRVIEEICSDEFRMANSIQVGAAAVSDQRPDRALSDSEEELIEAKLRGLGYL